MKTWNQWVENVSFESLSYFKVFNILKLKKIFTLQHKWLRINVFIISCQHFLPTSCWWKNVNDGVIEGRGVGLQWGGSNKTTRLWMSIFFPLVQESLNFYIPQSNMDSDITWGIKGHYHYHKGASLWHCLQIFSWSLFW